MAGKWDSLIMTSTAEEQIAFLMGRHVAIGTTKTVTNTLLVVWMAAFVGWLLNPIWAWLGAGLALGCEWLLWRRTETISLLRWEDYLRTRIEKAEGELLEVERQLGELEEPYVSPSADEHIMDLEQQEWDDYRRTRYALRAARHLAYARLGNFMVRGKWEGGLAGSEPRGDRRTGADMNTTLRSIVSIKSRTIKTWLLILASFLISVGTYYLSQLFK